LTRLVHAVTHPITARYFMRGQPAWLARRGFEVTVVASPGPDLLEVAQREEVAVAPVAMARKPEPVADAVALLRLVRLFRRLRPASVNAGTPKAGLLGGPDGVCRGPRAAPRPRAAGRRRAVELFRPEVVWEALIAEYDRLLAERGLAPQR
jgi:hypothetical protein